MLSHFYKYTDIETAEAILTNQTFRYSSPIKFNDPFDIQKELLLNFNLNDFPKATMDMIEHYVKNNEPIPNTEDGFGKAILLLRKKTKLHGYKKKELEAITYPLLGHLVGEIQHAIEGINQLWKVSLQESRVFCVTENKDNLLMWAHYAKDHTGAVFKLASLVEEDSALSAAKKVTYENKPVQFYSIDDLIKWTIFDIKPDISQLSYALVAHQKSKHWSYENEWRVVDMCQYKNKTELYVDHKFIPKQIESIYFGCKAEPAKVKKISSMAKAINPYINIYQSRERPLEYALDFEKI